LPNGILALKGGNLKEEILAMGKKQYAEVTPITKYFKDEYFQEKNIVYVQG
jgi:16S rRNA (guanine527-N7)-methyltransferase